jgi:hypothetical protein
MFVFMSFPHTLFVHSTSSSASPLRTHQIRVHLQDRRTPILGDGNYGNEEWNHRYARTDGVRRPLLHAYEMEFDSPFGSNKSNSRCVTLRAPIPQDMAAIIRKVSATNPCPLLDEVTGLLTCNTEVNEPQRLQDTTNLPQVAMQKMDYSQESSGRQYAPIDGILLKRDLDDWLEEHLSDLEEDFTDK